MRIKIIRLILLGLLSLGFVLGQQALFPVVTPASLSSHLESGRNLYSAGRFTEAIEIWEQAEAAYQRAGDLNNQAMSLAYLSSAYQELSQWEAAKTTSDQSLALLNSQSPAIIWAVALNTKGNLQLAQGAAHKALNTWEQAQRYYEQAGDSFGALGAQINQGQALQSLGFYRRSRKLLEKVNTELIATPNSLLKVSGLRSLGEALQVVGNLETSQQVLEYTLAVAQQLQAKPELSPILLSLGNNAMANQQWATALGYFQQAQQNSTTPLAQIEAQLNQLKVQIELEQWQQIYSSVPQIQQLLTDLPASRMSIYSIVNFADSLSKLPQQPIAAVKVSKLLGQAVNAARSLQDAQAQAYALNQWGKLYTQKGQLIPAIDLTQKSLVIAQSINAVHITSQAAWQLGQIRKQQHKNNEAIAAYTQAVNALQSLRTDLATINPEVQFSFRESVEPVYRELVALLLDNNPSQSNLSQARELIEALQLAELDNFFRQACIDAQPQQIDQIDAKAAVIYPIILPDRLAVIVSTSGKPLRYYSTPISQEEVEMELREMLAALNPVSDNFDRLEISTIIYDWLIHPAEAEGTFTDTETLVFVLDGMLRNIPITALYDGQNYLIEKYSVALSPGLQLIEPQALNHQEFDAFVGGISEARFGLTALPGVESEINDIAQLIPASTFINQEFTKNALSKQVKNSSSNIVHLATHGQFSSRQEDTFLLTWEGRINVQELSELLQNRDNRQNDAVELLVLSACDTAAGDNRAALGLAGFAVRSGARATIATLWPVKDQAAAELMNYFYQQLQQPGITKAQALRQAQLALLKNPSYDDPFFWSPFVLVGNWL